MHLVFMVAWFAGLFYMFRLFVYHVESKTSSDRTTLLKTMEYRLFYYITTPAMIGTILFGTLLFIKSGVELFDQWFITKLIFVLLLVIYQFYIFYTLKRFAKDDLFLTSKQCRIINEVPTIFLFFIIFNAVYRYL